MRFNLTLSLVACAAAFSGSCSSEPTVGPALPGFEALKNTSSKPIVTPAANEPSREEVSEDDGALSAGQIISECDRQIVAWGQAMARQRTIDNQEIVQISANAIGLFVTRYRDEIENQAISGKVRFQGIASAALGFSGDQSVLPILHNNLGSDDAVVVAKTLLGLGILSSPNTAMAPIADAVARLGSNTEVSSNAAFCLFQLGSTDMNDDSGLASSLLLSLVENPSSSVRAQSILALGLFSANHCLGVITNALSADAAPDVRVAAAWALGRIGANSSTVALVSALSDPDKLTSAIARASLSRIHGRDLGPDPESWLPASD
jgi:HEAT repeat protein